MEQDIIERYKALYSESLPYSSTDRLPMKLGTIEETTARLTAIYQLEVESRGISFIQDDFTAKSIACVAKWLHYSKQRGLLLYGRLGNGKTTMLRSIARLFHGRSFLLNSNTIYEHEKENSLVRSQHKLLLIDDLGTEPERCLVYGEERHPITDIILERYQDNLTTIIATNLSFDDIKGRYGARVLDRLIEMYAGLFYNGDSYRGKISYV